MDGVHQSEEQLIQELTHLRQQVAQFKKKEAQLESGENRFGAKIRHPNHRFHGFHRFFLIDFYSFCEKRRLPKGLDDKVGRVCNRHKTSSVKREEITHHASRITLDV